jgi:hypothetical protein
MADPRRRDIRPPELAALVDYAERPRAEGWSLRAALTRYAQPQPQRVGDLLDLCRRIDFVLGPQLDVVERDGLALWEAVGDDAVPTDDALVGLLRALAEIDRLGDALATWAVDRAGDRPDAAVDAVITGVRQRLADLGVPEQERPPGPRRRG